MLRMIDHKFQVFRFQNFVCLLDSARAAIILVQDYAMFTVHFTDILNNCQQANGCVPHISYGSMILQSHSSCVEFF